MAERSRFAPRQLVLLDTSLEGHFEVESEDGERLLDLHKAKGLPSVFAVWGAGKYYLSSSAGESVLDFSKKTVIASAVRLIEVRQSDSVRKNSAEISVPPEAIPIHQT